MTVKTFEGLPPISFSTLPTTGETIKITRGESGYGALPDAYMTADELNEYFDITKAQAAAMKIGSMFGWEVPGADPKRYDETGMLIREQK